MRDAVGHGHQHWHQGAVMIPAGYLPHTRRSPLTEPWEPLFALETADAMQLALEIRDAHCNSRGFAHGGLICALADNAMGHSAVRLARSVAGAEHASAVTASLTMDFIDTARVGDWVEFLPTVL